MKNPVCTYRKEDCFGATKDSEGHIRCNALKSMTKRRECPFFKTWQQFNSEREEFPLNEKSCCDYKK